MVIREFKNGNINISRKRYSGRRATSLHSFIVRVAEAIQKELGYTVEVDNTTLIIEGMEWTITYQDMDTFNFFNVVKCTALNLDNLLP